MADPELSLDEIAGMAAPPQEAPVDISQEPDPNQQDIEQLPGYRSGDEPTIDELASGMEQSAQPEQAGFSGYETEQKYRHPIMKGFDTLAIPHKALARKAVENAPAIKSVAKDILDDLGVDTSAWEPIDEEKWQTMMQSPELYGHDFVNLVTNAKKVDSTTRFLTGLAADFLDPALLVNELGGIAKGSIALSKEGKLASSAAQQFRNGERILGKIGPIELKSQKVAPWLMEKAQDVSSKLISKVDEKTGGSASRAWHWFSFNSETPELRSMMQEFRGAQNADTLENVRRYESMQPLLDGQTPETLAQAVSAHELPTAIDLEAQTIKGKTKYKIGTRGDRPFAEKVGVETAQTPYQGKTFFDPEIKSTNLFKPESDAVLANYVNNTLGPETLSNNLDNLTPEKFDLIQKSLIAQGHDGLDLSKTMFAKGRLGASEIKFSKELPAVFEPKFQTAIKEGQKFPNQALQDAHEIGAESYWQNLVDLNRSYGWLDEAGNPTRGFGIWSQKQLDELATNGAINGPKKYYPRMLDPAIEALDKQTGGKITEMFGGSNLDTGQNFSRGSSPYKARKYKDLTTVESADVVRGHINEVLKEHGVLTPYAGPVWDLDPVSVMTRKNQQVRTHLNKKTFLDKAATLGKTEREIALLPKAEHVRYEKFQLPRDTADILKEVGPDGAKKILGSQIDGKYFIKSDLDRIRDVMNFEPMSNADVGLNALATATRFFRKGVLFSPTYFMGNFKGNLINNVIAAPNKMKLADDYTTSFKIINDWKNKSGKIFTIAGKPTSADALINEMARMNLWDAGGIREITPLGQDIMNTANAAKTLKRQTGQMVNGLWSPFKFNQEFTELYADNMAKMSLYKNYLEAGYSKETAAKKVSDALFDFGDVSPGFERVRKVVPFVTYPAKMSSFAVKTAAKHPWLPEFVDRFGDLYTKANVTENPMDEDTLKNIMPTYHSYVFDPLVSQVLPGGNVMMTNLNSPFGSVEGLVKTITDGPLRAIPGAEEFFLLNLNRDPNSGQMIDDVKGFEQGFQGGMGVPEALTKSLFMEAIPKPVLFAMNQAAKTTGQAIENPYLRSVMDRVAKFAGNPYGSKLDTKVTKFRAMQDLQDQDLGQYFTTHNFLRKFAPDFFEQVIEKNDPEFYRSIGSVYRQHLKDVSFGFKTMTNADKEVFIRNYIFDNKMKEMKNAYEGIILKRDASMDPNYGADDIEKIDSDIEKIANQKAFLGKAADLIYTLGKKHNTEIKQGKDDELQQ